jgi:hypothetical protein
MRPTSTVHDTALFIATQMRSERTGNLVSGGHPAIPMSYGTNTRRKPMLLLRLSGLLLLRFADRQLMALLFQLPPRNTRFEPGIAARVQR